MLYFYVVNTPDVCHKHWPHADGAQPTWDQHATNTHQLVSIALLNNSCDAKLAHLKLNLVYIYYFYWKYPTSNAPAYR